MLCGVLILSSILIALPTHASESCPLKTQGDADCNGSTALADFVIWRDEYLGILNTDSDGDGQLMDADFSQDTRVTLLDYSLWRSAYLNPSATSTPTPTLTLEPTITPTIEPTATPTPTPPHYTVGIHKMTEATDTIFSHVLDTYYPNRGRIIRDISMEITINTERGVDGWYYALSAFMDGAGCRGYTSGNVGVGNCIAYMGVQANGIPAAPGQPAVMDKMALFSVWDSTQANPPIGGWEVTFGGEGIGKSNRIPFNWIVGRKYRFAMGEDEALSTGSSKWWSSQIIDVATNEVFPMGSIKLVEGTTGATSAVIFQEKFSGQVADCTQTTPSSITAGNVVYRFTDGTVEKQTARDHFVRNVSGACGDLIQLSDDATTDSFKNSVNAP